MKHMIQDQRQSNPHALYQEYALEVQAFCEKVLSPYAEVESDIKLREWIGNPLFKTAIIKRIVQHALHMMPDDVLEENVYDKNAFLNILQEKIELAATEWFRTRRSEYAIQDTLNGVRTNVFDALEQITRSNDQHLKNYEEVRHAEYVPMTASDIPRLIESYDRYVIEDTTWEMLLDGKVKEFCKKTRSGSFVLRSDEVTKLRAGSKRRKKPMAFAEQLEEEFAKDAHPGMLEGRILKSKQTGDMLAGVLFRQPPEYDSQESEDLQRYLRNGLTGEIHFVGRKRREYLEKIDQILQGELILQNKRFAANRLFHLWTREMKEVTQKSRQQLCTVLEYQLAYVTMRGSHAKDPTLHMNGYNDASSLFTTKRGLQVCAYDDNPLGPYVERSIKKKEVQITPAWLVKRGDLTDIQRFGQLEWEETQMIHGDMTEDK